MGCSSCGGKAAAAAAQYPREITLPDGTKVTVNSASQERTERERYRQRERAAAKTKGYTVGR
jgi:hypothetical protein